MKVEGAGLVKSKGVKGMIKDVYESMVPQKLTINDDAC